MSKNTFSGGGSGDDDFSAMFENSLNQGLQKINVGQTLKAEILSIGKESTFVQLNPSTDGVLSTLEILNNEKQITHKVGDTLDVVVVRVRDGEVRVSRAGSKKANADLGSLEDAFDMELPVEGKVIEPCKGGYRVQVMNATAFCPISQMDLRVSSEAEAYVGKKFEFIVTQFDPHKRNIVVSRRRLLEQLRLENEGELLKKLSVGEFLEGKVTRVENYGAFVEIESGIEGLIHVSELSWSRTNDARETIQPETSVRVKVLKIDEIDGRLKISLSLKQGGAETDPWIMIEQNFPLGSSHNGVVEKREVFGLFVSLSPGIMGLLPKAKWRDDLEAKAYENKKKGDSVRVQIDSINLLERKLSLGLPMERDDGEWKDHVSTNSTKSQNGFNNSGFGELANLLKKNRP